MHVNRCSGCSSGRRFLSLLTWKKELFPLFIQRSVSSCSCSAPFHLKLSVPHLSLSRLSPSVLNPLMGRCAFVAIASHQHVIKALLNKLSEMQQVDDLKRKQKKKKQPDIPTERACTSTSNLIENSVMSLYSNTLWILVHFM